MQPTSARFTVWQNAEVRSCVYLQKVTNLVIQSKAAGGRCLKSCQLPQPRFETIAQNGFGNVNLIMLLIAATSKFK